MFFEIQVNLNFSIFFKILGIKNIAGNNSIRKSNNKKLKRR
jgi:hypothetical protein